MLFYLFRIGAVIAMIFGGAGLIASVATNLNLSCRGELPTSQMVGFVFIAIFFGCIVWFGMWLWQKAEDFD